MLPERCKFALRNDVKIRVGAAAQCVCVCMCTMVTCIQNTHIIAEHWPCEERKTDAALTLVASCLAVREKYCDPRCCQRARLVVCLFWFLHVHTFAHDTCAHTQTCTHEHETTHGMGETLHLTSRSQYVVPLSSDRTHRLSVGPSALAGMGMSLSRSLAGRKINQVK